MSSLLINVPVNEEAGTNLKSDEYGFMNYRHHVSRFSPISSTFGSGSLGSLYQTDGSRVSEESVSSTQSDGLCIYRDLPLQDPIGTPRRPSANSRQVDRERDTFKADVMNVTGAEPNCVSAEISDTCRNAENIHRPWIATADLHPDQDDALPCRPVTPRFVIASLPLSKEPIQLPRLYTYNSRIRACADDAVRRMRMQVEQPKQNFHSFRRHPFPIGGSNPFQPLRQRLRQGGESLGHIISSVERLVEDDDEDTLVYIESRLSVKERMLQEVRQRKNRPAILGSRSHNRYLAKRLLYAPRTYRHLYAESIFGSGHEAGDFYDFPVCEMSIAMGLHDSRR